MGPMALWKQLGIALALVAAVLVTWAMWLPASAPLFARLGIAVQTSAESAGNPGGGPGGMLPGAGGPGRGGPPTVVAAEVGEGASNGRISAIGDGRAIRSVAVTPLAQGRIVEVSVAPGDRVEAGDALARLDDDAEAIGLARAELAVEDAETTLERLERLRGTGATTDVQLREARLALDRARLELRDADLALERRTITAPIAGIVGILPVEPGQQVTTTTEIATIDDRSAILVDFRIPERWVGQIDVGAPLEAVALARPDLALDGRVHAIDNRVDQATRTLRVQAMIPNEGDVLRAGMAFRIAMTFPGEAHPAVDPLAIQWSSEGAYVWAVREERVQRVPVRIVQRSSERVLVAGAIRPGERVVIEGVQRLREGAEVAVRPEGAAGEDAGLGLTRAAPGISDT
jgi:RND family efflux transporter MFP subunit